MNRDLEYYLKLDYPFVTKKYYDKGKQKYLIEYPDLPGCSSHGETLSKAYSMAEKAKNLWLETCIKEEIKIPEPRAIEEYSGRFVLRPSKSLHYELSNLAKQENTSLNQCILQLISKGLGKREAENDYKKELQELESILKSIGYRLEKLESKVTQWGIQEILDVEGESTKFWPLANWGGIRKLSLQATEKTPDTSSRVINMEGKKRKRREVTTT